MSDLHRFFLRGEFRSRLMDILPGVTRADLAAFEVLVVTDRVIGDDGAEHPDLVAWLQAILDRDEGDALAVPLRPVPQTGPAGAVLA